MRKYYQNRKDVPRNEKGGQWDNDIPMFKQGKTTRSSSFLKMALKRKGLRCYYCKEKVTKCYNPLDKKRATVEHLYSKNDIRRFLVPEEENMVIACWECNDKKNLQDIKRLEEIIPTYTISLIKWVRMRQRIIH